MSQKHLYYNKHDEHYDRRHIAFLTAIGTAIGIGGGATAATLGGAALVGTAAFGAVKTVQAITAKPPTAPLPDFGISAPAVQAAEPSVDKAAAEAQLNIVQKRRSIARNRTNFTRPTGLTIEDKSNITLKTLTGV